MYCILRGFGSVGRGWQADLIKHAEEVFDHFKEGAEEDVKTDHPKEAEEELEPERLIKKPIERLGELTRERQELIQRAGEEEIGIKEGGGEERIKHQRLSNGMSAKMATRMKKLMLNAEAPKRICAQRGKER